MTQHQRLAGRVALITGASRGIGAAVAKAFAREGAHVVLLARTVGALEALDDAIRAEGGSATLIPADLTDLSAVDSLGPLLLEKFGRLDILVANAADLGTLGPIAHTDLKKWDRVMRLNVDANFRLIRTLDPLLRASSAGRAIFVTSGVTAAPRAYWGAYAVSKAALEMLAGIYAAETATTSLRVNLLDPGRVRTGMRASAYPGEDPQTLPPPESVTEAFVTLAMADETRHGETIAA